MPSASAAKPEKQASVEATPSETASSSNNNNPNTPIRQCLTIIEHKIRNLEKRKAKLETYRELQNAGKELNQDQKTAVAKYDEVFHTLEFARELCKQYNTILATAEKEAKKQARKEAAERTKQEISKVEKVLLIQDALQRMGDDTTREDFLLGRNGASPISADDLQLLDDLYPVVSPKHASESVEPSPDFPTQVHQAAEHLISVADGKQKEFSTSTYARVKEVINIIHDSGYLDKTVPQSELEQELEGTEVQEQIPVLNEEIVVDHQLIETEVACTIEPERVPELPPMPNFPPVPEVVQPVVPVVEQPYYAQPQQQRPITEMLGSGSFFFLQESELDSSPDIPPQHQIPSAPAPIPSQTFTNQNFASVPSPVQPISGYAGPNPPPPIPMPPSHVTAPQMSYNADDVPTSFPPAQQFDNFTTEPQTEIENGDASRDSDKGDWADSTDDRTGVTQGNRPKGGGRNRSGNNGYYNSYYQNNGYSGGGGNNYKPRGNRSGGNRGARGGQYNRNKQQSGQQQH